MFGGGCRRDGLCSLLLFDDGSLDDDDDDDDDDEDDDDGCLSVLDELYRSGSAALLRARTLSITLM